MSIAVLIANPQVPGIVEWQELLSTVIVLAILAWAAFVLVRFGWRVLARLLAAFVIAAAAALPMVWVNVIIVCGFCCELFWEWLCLI